jgi:hypothetical protein
MHTTLMHGQNGGEGSVTNAHEIYKSYPIVSGEKIHCYNGILVHAFTTVFSIENLV